MYTYSGFVKSLGINKKRICSFLFKISFGSKSKSQSVFYNHEMNLHNLKLYQFFTCISKGQYREECINATISSKIFMYLISRPFLISSKQS